MLFEVITDATGPPQTAPLPGRRDRLTRAQQPAHGTSRALPFAGSCAQSHRASRSAAGVESVMPLGGVAPGAGECTRTFASSGMSPESPRLVGTGGANQGVCAVHDHVDRAAVTLNVLLQQYRGGAENDLACAVPDRGREHQVDHAGLVLQSAERHSLGRRGHSPESRSSRGSASAASTAPVVAMSATILGRVKTPG